MINDWEKGTREGIKGNTWESLYWNDTSIDLQQVIEFRHTCMVCLAKQNKQSDKLAGAYSQAFIGTRKKLLVPLSVLNTDPKTWNKQKV